MILQKTQKIPLEKWKDGSIRVKGTRLLVDMIINAHRRGEKPEDIFESFPSDDYSVADIYLIIAYYLSNQAEFEKYFAKREEDAQKVWKKIESLPNYQANQQRLKEKLLVV